MDADMEAIGRAIDELGPALRLVSVVCQQESPLLVSVNGAGSVPAIGTMTLGDSGYALWAAPGKPVVFGAGGGGGTQGLFGTSVDQSGSNANAGGDSTVATGDNSLAVGHGSSATGESAVALGVNSEAPGFSAVAAGNFARANGDDSAAFNNGRADGQTSLAEGEGYAQGRGSHAEGQAGTGVGADYAHAEGGGVANASYAHAEGYLTRAIGGSSHAEGSGTEASGDSAHAEGSNTAAPARWAHSEGRDTTASNEAAHAEGRNTTASGEQSHAEGEDTIASGTDSHAEGGSTEASGDYSHAEGDATTASGEASHAEGNFTFANGTFSHVQGDGGRTFRAMEDATSSQNPDRTLQHTILNIVSDWPTGDIHIGGGTNPIMIPVHDGHFDGKVTIWLGAFTDRWDLTFRGSNDAVDFAGRDTGTVTIDASAGGGASVYGSSPITWAVSGDSAGNVLITPSATTGATARYAHVDMFELHANS